MGGGGTIIIRNNVAVTLKEPLVSGLVPTPLRADMDCILAKEPGMWTDRETRYALLCLREALC